MARVRHHLNHQPPRRPGERGMSTVPAEGGLGAAFALNDLRLRRGVTHVQW